MGVVATFFLMHDNRAGLIIQSQLLFCAVSCLKEVLFGGDMILWWI